MFKIFKYFQPPQCNDNVLLCRRELAGSSFRSVEFLFNACGNGVSTKFEKGSSNKCILANSFFQTTDKIVSSVTHRTYSCTDYEKSYVTYNSPNIMYIITCSYCFMQYFGEPTQQLNTRLATHRASRKNKLKLR